MRRNELKLIRSLCLPTRACFFLHLKVIGRFRFGLIGERVSQRPDKSSVMTPASSKLSHEYYGVESHFDCVSLAHPRQEAFNGFRMSLVRQAR